MTAIWWIRRDLRLTDNPTLHAASEPFDQTQDKAGDVVPCAGYLIPPPGSLEFEM